MASFTVNINQRANSDGLYSIFVRVAHKGKSKRIKMSFRIPVEHFNRAAKYGKWVRATNLKHKVYNVEIEKKINELKSEYDKLAKVHFSAIDHIGEEEEVVVGVSIKTYFDRYLSNLKNDTAINSYKQQVSILARFTKYFGERVALASIDTSHVAEFKKSLLLKGLGGVSVNLNLSKIRSVFIVAINEGIIDKDPFRANKRMKSVAKGRIKLSDSEIDALATLDLSGGRKGNWRKEARDYYLFSFYNAGIRVSDLMQLRHSNIVGDRLDYQMGKTGHKKSIKLNRPALDILNKYMNPKAKDIDYIFPILDNKEVYAKYATYEEKRAMPWEIRLKLYADIKQKSRRINNMLAKIAVELNLSEKLTFHTARHSFADKARRAMKTSSKITLMDIKNSMGHTTIETTEKYMKSFDFESLDEAMDSIFE